MDKKQISSLYKDSKIIDQISNFCLKIKKRKQKFIKQNDTFKIFEINKVLIGKKKCNEEPLMNKYFSGIERKQIMEKNVCTLELQKKVDLFINIPFSNAHVERSFSTLKYIIGLRRTRLSTKRIKLEMMIRMNHK